MTASRIQRGSAIGVGLPFGFPLPNPDGTISSWDRQHAATAYAFDYAESATVTAGTASLFLNTVNPSVNIIGGGVVFVGAGTSEIIFNAVDPTVILQGLTVNVGSAHLFLRTETPIVEIEGGGTSITAGISSLMLNTVNPTVQVLGDVDVDGGVAQIFFRTLDPVVSSAADIPTGRTVVLRRRF